MRPISQKLIALFGIFAAVIIFIAGSYIYLSKNSDSSQTSGKPSAAGIMKTIPILMYHHVNERVTGEKYYFVSPDMFLRQMRYLFDSGYETLTFENLKKCTKCQKLVMLTFDDGYLDNYLYAYPVLEMFDFKATVFLSTGFLNKSDFISTRQLKLMSGIISFQSHTVNHLNLSRIDSEQIAKECKESKNTLESLLSKKISTIAYPYGQYNQHVIDIVKKYYKYGVSADDGYYRTGDDAYRVKRIAVTPADTLEAFKRKLDGSKSKTMP